MTDLKTKKIWQLAGIIANDWTKPNYAAAPYLRAMFSLENIEDNYMYDSGKGIVLRFLCNAGSWRGETARAVKAELKRRTK